MGKPDAPAPPDPKTTAAAQTSTNIGTAIANNSMQMVDQYTPWGNLTYDQTGTYTYVDPLATQNDYSLTWTPQPTFSTTGQPFNPESQITAGQPAISPTGQPFLSASQTKTAQGTTPTAQPGVYEIPTYSATVTLPEFQQQALDAQFQTNAVLSNTALDQANFLSGYLGDQIDTNQMPALRGQGSELGLRQQTSIAPAGGIQRGVGQTALQDSINYGVGIQNTVDPVSGLRYGTGMSEAEMRAPSTYGSDFSQNRMDVETALMDRMEPYLQQDRQALQAQLANQGIVPGSEAYKNAMDDQARKENDARLGAILGASEEQARLTGMERDRAIFEGNAQAQRFGQGMAGAQFYNQAAGQQFGQNMQSMAAQNAAQAQGFGQAAQRAAFANDAANQKFAQGLASGQFANQAQAQQFGQNAQQAGMFNTAQQNMYNAEMADAAFANAARNQAMQEAFALRNQPINEITALLSGGQVTNPGLQAFSPGGIPTVDYAGLVNQNYNQQMGAYNQEMANYNSLMGGLFGLGSSAIGLF